ncbi:intermembrane space protein sorting protein [Schizosaccharomyces japonicus yFS275]|uniref:Intermembrane space protein sorting protein n=1 Tax=Schizosaccharomyces japonicus (strain yFS275 / FY16936) TaxID=402676 RepID=B6JV29_SCHJY|nr:intermembrane space protein sorting protein [Schizosaccharomyces japonicus yFS275]EEB05230.2 intermembrane space protein sorting protein [Schizosaccharomyces japonicus yFS275]
MDQFAYSTKLEHPWDDVSLGWLNRYPNPNSAHVLSSDIIERYVDDKGRLYTERCLSKRVEFLNGHRNT